MTTTCVTCPTSSSSPISSSALAACTCNVGFTGTNGGVCTACVAGTYKTATGSATCTDCGTGTYSAATGATAAATCVTCPAGQISPSASTSSAACYIPDCNAGYTGPSGGPCVACVAGKYKSLTGSAACSNCGTGTYSAATGATAAATCVTCPTSSSSPIASSTLTACTCNVGFTGPSGGTCLPCAAGTFKSSTGNVSCTACAYGSNSTSGQSACFCLAGFFANGSVCIPFDAKIVTVNNPLVNLLRSCGTSQNQQCSTMRALKIDGGIALPSASTGINDGTVNSEPHFGYTDCKDQVTGEICNTFDLEKERTVVLVYAWWRWDYYWDTQWKYKTYSVRVGNTNIAYVTGQTFIPGSWNTRLCTPTTGLANSVLISVTGVPYANHQRWSSGCSNNVKGRYFSLNNDGADSPEYREVQAYGYLTGDGAQSTYYACNAGYTGPTGGPCTACGAGTYSTTVGASTAVTCVTCPTNSSSSISSSALAACTCNVGYSGANGGPCTACVAGKYKNATVSTNCTDCAVDTFQNATASVECQACPAGFRALSATTTVQDCCGLNSRPELYAILCILPNLARSCGTSGVQACTPSSSSFYPDYGLTPYANDGTGNSWISNGAGSQWWQVDFSRQVTVNLVVIYNRGYRPETLANFNLQLSTDGTNFINCATGQYGSTDWSNGLMSTHTCIGPARFLRISMNVPGGAYMQVQEVLVYGVPTTCSFATQCLCNTGYTGADRGASKGQCTVCPAGTYKSSNGSAACTSCAVNANSSVGSTNVSACSCNPGYTGPDVGPCVACQAGKFKNVSGTAACMNCTANSGASCSGCKALDSCTCNAGFYGPNGGTCTTCPANSGASCSGCTTLANCTCNVGYTGPNGEPCSACVAGTYKTATGSVLCTNCSAGTYSITVGATVATTCLACPVAKYSTTLGANNLTFCLNCPGNSNSPSTSTVLTACICNVGYTGPNGGPCTACVAGTYKTTTGSVLCTNCAAGTYSTTVSATVATTCLACPVAKYSATLGAINVTTCLECPANTNSPSASPAVTSCICNVGYTGPNGGPCSTCVAGTYKTATGSVLCTNCAAGTYSSNITATVATTCLACPVAKYSATLGAINVTTCLECPANANSPSASPAVTSCTCMARFYGSNGGPCTSCPANSGASCSGCTVLTGCTCDLGFTGPNGGNCTACIAGTYKTVTGTAVCTNCTAKTYSTTLNATAVTTCLACPVNSNSPIQSAVITRCTCNMGYTGPDGANCTACEAGKYKNATGSALCIACPSGGAASIPGAFSPTDCCGLNSVATCPTLNWARSCGTSGNQACVATSQSVYQNNVAAFGPMNAIDGNLGTESNSVFVNQGTQWWQVDFSREVGINTVTIYNTYNNPAWLSNFNLQLSNDGTTFTNCATAQVGSTTAAGDLISQHICDGSGRYLRLFANLPINSYLEFREIQIYGNCSFTKALQCQCDAGYTGPNLGASRGNCTTCTAGTYKNTTGSVACTTCTAGTYSTSTNATICLACAANSGASCSGCSASTSCTCNDRFYGPNGGPCTACPANSGASCSGCKLVTNCTCNLGYTGPDGVVCSACPSGTYKPNTGSTQCSTCPANSGASCSGCTALASCTCNAGFYGPSGGACTTCPANSGASCSGCTVLTGCTCNAGFYGPNGGACTTCPANSGKSCSGCTVLTGCTCNAGFYGPNGGACTTCPANSGASCSGCTVLTACTCNVGFTGPNGGVCSACIAGTYKTTTGSVACTNCGAGTYSATAGASNASVCTLCANNTFSAVIGSPNASLCQSCQANAVSSAGSVAQVYCYCKAGYAHAEGEFKCNACTPGTYNSQLAQRACSNCTIGLYSVNYSATGLETCLPCPAGQWSPEGSANCNLCPPYSHTLGTSGSIFDCVCDAGYTGPAGSTCTPCAAGTYKTTTGSSQCTSCPAGTTSPIGSTSSAACVVLCNAGYTGPSGGPCTACGAGKYKIATGSALCTDCSAGTYSTTVAATAAATCGACPGNSNSPISSSALAACTCVAGTYANAAIPESCTDSGNVVIETENHNYYCSDLTGGDRDISDCWNLCQTCCVTCASYCGTPMTTTCVTCPTSSNSPISSSAVAACTCNVGFSGPDGSGPCTACIAGKYKPATGSAVCTDCAAGTYLTTTGATAAAACVACPANSNSPQGSTAAESCACNVGFALSNNTCVCDLGYQPGP